MIDLGEPRARIDLPSSWRLAVSLCPHCAGTGYETPACGNPGNCGPCDGSGNLLGALLLDAYRRGRDHTLSAVRQVAKARETALQSIKDAEPTIGEIMRAEGLGDGH